MTRLYAAQVAAECDELLDELTSHWPYDAAAAVPFAQITRTLARAGAVLHLLGEQNTDADGCPLHWLPGAGGARIETPEMGCPTCRTGSSTKRDAPVETAHLRRAIEEMRAERDRARRELDDVLDELSAEPHLADATAEDYRRRWHEAATQRDTLARAARELLNKDTGTNRSNLHSVVVHVESGALAPRVNADRLRRELWAVLDRMPTSDEDLIAAVRELVGGRGHSGELIAQVMSERERARAQRDELLAALQSVTDANGQPRHVIDVARRIEEDRA